MASTCLESDVIKLRPEQKAVASYLLDNHGILAIHSTGTGKTLTSAAAAACLVMSGQVEHVVVLAKKSALSQFEAEVRRYWGDRAPIPLLCTTHQQFFTKNAKDVVPSKTFMIVDEAHEFTNPLAAGTKRILKFSQACHRILLLTATPIVNTSYDLAPLIAMVRGAPVLARAAFEEMLAKPSAFKKYFKGAVHVNMIDKNADPHYPHVKVHKVAIPMGPTTAKQYAVEAKKHMPFDINLRQLSLGYGECEKCAWLMRHIKDWIARGEGKILIYTAFLGRGSVLLTKLLKESGVNTLLIDSKANGGVRHKAALLFNKNSEPDADEERDLRDLVKSQSKTKVGTRCGEDRVMLVRESEPLRAKKEAGKQSYAFSWTSPDGKPKKLTPTEQAYVNELVIPPAWSPAEVCKKGDKLAWVAQDKKGNWQYRYTAEWQTQQEYKKILRLKELTKAFWKRLKSTTDRHLKGSTWNEQKLLAVATKVMETCHFRAGTRDNGDDEDDEDDDDEDEDDADADAEDEVEADDNARPAPAPKKHYGHNGHNRHNRHYGLMTLQSRHVKVNRASSVQIKFIGKSGKTNTCELTTTTHGPPLVKAMRELALAQLSKRKNAPFFMGTNAAQLRSYLAAIQPGVRPKDFRTYFANYTLLDQLRTAPLPHEQTPRQRSARMREATLIISKGLNNTPEVSKSSYIFTGFWVLYLTDPMQFNRVLAKLPSDAPTVDVLTAFVKFFDENAIDWQTMLKRFKESGGIADFTGLANVLLITDAGAESIDLSGTRHIVFMNPTWTPALEAQIIGRGQRYDSHAALPESQRTVHVWKLFLDYPNKEPAVERHMENLVRDKEAEQNRIYKGLTLLNV